MISHNRIALIALIGSVFLTAVLVAGNPIEDGIATAHGATQSTAGGLLDLGRGVMKSLGSVVKPFVDGVRSKIGYPAGANQGAPRAFQTTTAAPTQAEVEDEKKEEAQVEKKEEAQVEKKEEAQVEKKEETPVEKKEEAQTEQQEEAQHDEQQKAQANEQQGAQAEEKAEPKGDEQKGAQTEQQEKAQADEQKEAQGEGSDTGAAADTKQ